LSIDGLIGVEQERGVCSALCLLICSLAPNQNIYKRLCGRDSVCIVRVSCVVSAVVYTDVNSSIVSVHLSASTAHALSLEAMSAGAEWLAGLACSLRSSLWTVV
jgi:hypothetical protein